MDIILKIVAMILIVSGIIWFTIFHLKKKKMFADYANKKLSNYNDDDIIPDDTAADFLSTGMKDVFKIILIHTLIPYGLILLGALLIIFSTQL